MIRKSFLFATLVWAFYAFGEAEVMTNHLQAVNAPSWMTESALDKASSRIQDTLEWDVRRIRLIYHSNKAEFQKLGNVGPKVKAYFLRSDSTIHLGPEVTKENLAPILSHEMVHVIFYQKYKTAIPAWLEEGLANYLGSQERADKQWLRSQTLPDVTSLRHPATDPFGSKLHYQLSTAVIEMLVQKCDLKDLLHLSVGRKMETHMKHLCGIEDVNAELKKWLEESPKPSLKVKK